MRRRHEILWLMALASMVAVSGCTHSEATTDRADVVRDAIEVDLAPVERAEITSALELVGTLLPVRTTTIVSDVDGIIQSFPVRDRRLEIEYVEDGVRQGVPLGLDIGHAVRQGDLLAQIDPVDFELALKAVEAERDLAKRNLEKLLAFRRPEEDERLQAALTEAKAADERARADLRRSEELFTKRTISRGTHDATVMAARIAAAVMRRADAAGRLYLAGPTREEIAVAEAQVATAEAQVALRKEKLDKTAIRAPYDAIVCNRYVGVGDRVTAMPRVEIMQIMDPRILFAEVAVPEKHQGRIKLDDRATVTAESGLAVSARVDLINAMVDPETRTFRIRVTIDNTTATLKPGGFVHVELPVKTASRVLTVPVDAVTFTEGRPAVFVWRDGRVHKTPVKVGISDGTVYEISGVPEGTSVVVGRTSLLADGLTVQAKRPGASADPPAAAPAGETPP